MISKIKEKAKNWLIWSQRYTRTDMLYLAKGGFWLSVAQAVSSLMSFILAVAFANLLTKDVYGTYRYILSIAGILSALTLSGMSTSVIQAVAQGYEGTLKKSILVQLKWGLILVLAALSGSIYYFLNHNQTIAIALLFIGGLYPIISSFNTYGAFIDGKKDFKRATKYGIGSSLINGISLLVALLLTRNPLWLVLVYLSSSAVGNVIFYLRTLAVFKPNKEVGRESISYGKHLSLINVITIVAGYLDKLLVYHYLGAADLAIYAIAIAPPEQLKSLFKNISSIALPKLSEHSRSAKEIGLTSKTWRFFFVLMGVSLAYIVAAPWIYKIFFPTYESSIFISQVFALSLCTISLSLPSSFLTARAAKKELYQVNIFTSIIQIALYLILIPIWGLIGVILARIIYRFINFGLNLHLADSIN